MWRVAVCSMLTLIILAAPNPALAGKDSTASINWLTFDKAQKFKDGNRKFFVYFHADWCGYCHKLKKNAFANTEVIAYINANFVPVKVDTEKEKKLAARFGVQSLPDLRFLTPGGKGLARWPGYLEKDHLLNLLQYIHTDSFDKMNFSDFVKQKK